jgi:hypothetical protein
MCTNLNRADRREPSYFDFLMTNRRPGRAVVPFAQAAGILPARCRDARVNGPAPAPQQ